MVTTQMRGAKAGNAPDQTRPWLLFAAILAGALAVLFYQSFEPGQVLFANDGSLGAMKALSNRLPGRFTGTWQCLSWLGIEAPAASPGLSAILATIVSPEIYLKIYAPLTLFFVGFCAWVFFRQLELAPMVCVLGGVAAGLNMHFFSIACWGLGAWNVSAGMIFLALAALSAKSIRQTWAKSILAGLAVGLNLMEGFDSGAILSLYLGAFVIFRAFNQRSGLGAKLLTAIGSAGLVIPCAALIAAHTLSSLFETQVKDVARSSEDTPMEKRWDFSTQWSLPKLETLRVIIPGLFGYRMDQFITGPDKSSAYWGQVGQDPRIAEMRSNDPQLRANSVLGLELRDEERKGLQNDDARARASTIGALRTRYQMRSRHSGSGEYAGVLVSILAVFALANARRGGTTPYSPGERRAIWFWGVAALASLLAAWGRHGFVYRALFQLPFFSSIRNPVKFMHPFHLAWVILAAYGLEALHRRYIKNPSRRVDIVFQHVKLWLTKASGFEKKWAVASLLIIALCLAGLLVLDQYKGALIGYLHDQGFSANLAPAMAAFSFSEAVWFVVFLALSLWVLLGILSGAWSGARAKWAWIYLAAAMVLDLGRSDKPWILYFDSKTIYSTNPVLDFLDQNPYEHRVVGRLSPIGPYNISANDFSLLYHFWLQNDFPYHNIQALDVAQWPRMPLMDSNYLANFICTGTNMINSDLRPAVRLFELTNTRYILANAGAAPLLNGLGDPAQRGFQIRKRLVLEPKLGVSEVQDFGGLTVETSDDGPFALIEFTRALPRAKLYGNWKSPGDDAATLKTLASSDFDPWQTVLVAAEPPLTQVPSDPQSDPGTVAISDYRPKYVKLQAHARTPAILLLNDRFTADWTLSVDQKPAPVLRCNYLMRGAVLSPGEHTVEFRFQPPLAPLYVSLGTWMAGILLAGYVFKSTRSVKQSSMPAGKP
jgi:hypothetical protein